MRCAAIEFKNVSIAYNQHPALQNITGAFGAGSLTAIAGPNGAGKSTLLKGLMGELPVSAGKIERNDLSIHEFGYLPQASELDRQYPLSVADIVIMGAWRKIGVLSGVTQQIAEKVHQALQAVGLEGFEGRHISALSTGQFQRVLFARLLMQEAQVIILDEPFAAVDARTTHDLLNIVKNWHEEGKTIIAVLHDFEQVRMHFPNTCLLARELIAWGATQDVMKPENLLRARALAENWDDDCAAEAPIRMGAA